MEETFEKANTTQRLPGEVVEVYRPRDPREVVEVYSRPWPQTTPSPDTAKSTTYPEKRRRHTGFWIFLGCLGSIVLLTAVSLTLQWHFIDRYWSTADPFTDTWHDLPENTREITIPTWPVGQGAELKIQQEQGEVLSAQTIYRQVNPSVVQVFAKSGNRMALGTGVIFTEDGYILTNHHIIAGGEECSVMLPSGYSYSANYVASDEENDLAVLKIDGMGLPAATFGDSDFLTVGDPVYAIGNPLGYELWGTLTDGIISALNRDVQVDGRTMTLIQTNAALNTGNSGGPLINEYGQVVGLNVVKLSSSKFDIDGLGFAIPSVTIEQVVNDLLTYGEVQPQSVMGISVLQEAVQLEEDLWGVEIVSVTPGGAGELAGIRVGDFLVFAGGMEIHDSKDVLRARQQYRPGDEMPVTVWREGASIDITLVLQTAAE